MKKKSLWTILLALICLVLLGACAAPAPQKAAEGTPSEKSDTSSQTVVQPQGTIVPTPVMVTGDVTVSGTAVTEDTNNPGVKVVVSKGDLPSSCSQVQVDIKPDTDSKKIAIKIFRRGPRTRTSASKLLKAMRPESLWLATPPANMP